MISFLSKYSTTGHVFLASPDKYGRFGHSTLNLLSAFMLAHAFDGSFIPSPYSFHCHKWNKIVNLKSSYRAFNQSHQAITSYFSIENNLHYNGLKSTFDLNCFSGVGALLEKINALPNTLGGLRLIELPFDQMPGLLLTANNSARIDFRNCVSNTNIHKNPAEYACIHVRRGDVNADNHSSWFIEDIIYINVITAIREISCIPIIIVTQPNSNGTIPFQGLTNEFTNLTIRVADSTWTSDQEVDDFLTMMNARILIGGKSSFCQVAHYASSMQKNLYCLFKQEERLNYLPKKMITTINLESKSWREILKTSLYRDLNG
jgi:hypothetical protein